MTRPALVLFDDDVARRWRPFILTRPAGELLFGTRTLRRRAERSLGLECVGHVADPVLEDFDEAWAPPVLSMARLAQPEGFEGGAVFLLSRFAADPADLPQAPALLMSDGRVVGIRLAPGARPPDEHFFREPDARAPDLPGHELSGQLLGRSWELMSGNAERTARDLAAVGDDPLPDTVYRVGDGVVSLGRHVKLAPGVVLDTTSGPIRLDDGAQVGPFTYLVGPAYVGPGSSLLGGPFHSVSIGPHCKVHGEMEETVVLGYSNKAHDGFLGHAYVGMWVNLGALTTNSDLKNNYGPVRVWTPDGEVDTGKSKVGCFLGDHVKTAIGTMINTGTVIEAGTNIFGGMPPKYVPPFSWGDPDTAYGFDRFIATANTVMARRGIELTEPARRQLRAAWEAVRG